MARGRKPRLRPVPGAATETPRAPRWLPEAAQAEWRRAAPALVARRVLTEEAMATLEQYCLAVGAIREAQAAISRDGMLVDTPRGKRRHPAFQVIGPMLTESRRLAAELGLTPAARARDEGGRSRPPADEDAGEDLFSALGITGTPIGGETLQ